MIRRELFFLTVVLAVASCKRSPAPAVEDAPEASPEVGAARPAPLDPRSLLDLAQAIAAVEKADPDDADQGYADVVASFEGKTYRWQLYLVAALCTEAQCNAMPFPDGGRDLGVVGGWMPRIAIAPADRQRLLAECGAEPQCPFTVEATLTDLTANTEKFTSLTLEGVKLVSIR